MTKRICVLLGVGVIAWIVPTGGLGAEEKPGPKTVSVLDGLRARAGSLAPRTMPEDLARWEARRREVLAAVSQGLGLPAREPMRAETSYQKSSDDVVIEEVTYLWGERAYVAANVIRSPQATGPRPAIVVAPDWLGHYTRPACRESVLSMARLGYVVLFVNDPRLGKRVAPEAGLHVLASAAGTPVMGIQVFDALRGLDYLATRADVDPGRIGIVGFGQGVQVAWLAAALERRLQFVVAIDGATTLEALAEAAATKHAALPDPSAYPGNLARLADWDEIAAMSAPRPALVLGRSGDPCRPKKAYDRVLRTVGHAYQLSGSRDRLRGGWSEGPGGRSDPAAEVVAWLESQVKLLPDSQAQPAPCGKPEKPDFSMLRYLQRRIAGQAEARAAAYASRPAWEKAREDIVSWLRGACGAGRYPLGPARVVATSVREGIAEERLDLPIVAGLVCPAVLYRPAAASSQARPAVILSHDGRQYAGAAEIAQAAQRLVALGWWVVVPEHVSPHPLSPRRLEDADVASFYGLGEAVGLPPLALRVADNAAALAYLAGRKEVDPARIVAAGLGAGGIDACLLALLDPRVAGVVSVGATTLGDWADAAAGEEPTYLRAVPYLPSMLAKADLDGLYAAVAPRPLVIVRPKDAWPKSGFERVAATAAAVYRLLESEKSLLALGSREFTEEREKATPPGPLRPLVAVARCLVPLPPSPGIVGPAEGLRGRATVDSSSGLVWVVGQMAGEETEFVDGGYRLASWSFFNDNGAAERGRALTPLVFKKEGDAYKLTGIGKTRTNAGTGLQAFPFELVEGSDAVGAGFFFGFYTGSPPGTANAGVVEFDDSPDDRLTILTLEGGMEGQQVRLGAMYREQSSWPRAYSIQAVSKRK